MADQAGLSKLSMSEPITDIVEALTGYSRTTGASVPGIRKLWQYTGQVGWGAVSEQYPWTAERCVFVNMIRQQGRELSRKFKHVDWSQYGLCKSFWMDILLQGLKDHMLPTVAYDFTGKDAVTVQRRAVPGYAIVNIRFEHELMPAADFGFQVFHVACSEETRRERMSAVGYKQKPEEANDASEQLAPAVQAVIDDDHVIWNDHRPMPQGKNYWTLEDFEHYAKIGITYVRDMNKYRLQSVEGKLTCIAR